MGSGLRQRRTFYYSYFSAQQHLHLPRLAAAGCCKATPHPPHGTCLCPLGGPSFLLALTSQATTFCCLQLPTCKKIFEVASPATKIVFGLMWTSYFTWMKLGSGFSDKKYLGAGASLAVCSHLAFVELLAPGANRSRTCCFPHRRRTPRARRGARP